MHREKLERLHDLGARRKHSRWPNYTQVSDYHNGAYESPFVSPYTKAAHNVDASVMVLLQDWSSHEWLSGPVQQDVCEFGRKPSLPTNRNLDELLQGHFALKIGDIYATTNLFPFVKSGKMSSPIPVRDLVRAAHEFAVPQIDIVQPDLVVCLGKACFNALTVATQNSIAPSLAFAIDHPFKYNNAEIWCQAHTGAVGRNMRNRGNRNRVDHDWAKMAAHYTARRAFGGNEPRPPDSA